MQELLCGFDTGDLTVVTRGAKFNTSDFNDYVYVACKVKVEGELWMYFQRSLVLTDNDAHVLFISVNYT